MWKKNKQNVSRNALLHKNNFCWKNINKHISPFNCLILALPSRAGIPYMILKTYRSLHDISHLFSTLKFLIYINLIHCTYDSGLQWFATIYKQLESHEIHIRASQVVTFSWWQGCFFKMNWKVFDNHNNDTHYSQSRHCARRLVRVSKNKILKRFWP